MNKKKINYILALAVILIWGGIAHSFMGGFGDDEYVLNQSLPEVEMEEMENDTFLLAVNYRDPFLKRTYYNNSTTKNSSKSTKKKVITEVKKVPTVNWSFISYSGKIKNQQTGKHVGMLNIRGRDYLLNEGETKDEVKLVKLLEDSIKVLYQKKYAFIKKN